MKPKPLASLNHFTLPVERAISYSCCCVWMGVGAAPPHVDVIRGSRRRSRRVGGALPRGARLGVLYGARITAAPARHACAHAQTPPRQPGTGPTRGMDTAGRATRLERGR